MAEIKARHSRNIPALSVSDMEKLAASKVLVIGCGGLGGNIIEYLARAGVGSLTVVDGDVFEESNLNRQILSTSENIGRKKALAAAERIRAIDPSIRVSPVCESLTEENAAALMADTDLVIDALDNAASRLVLEDAAAEAGLAIVHGAICGWDLQAMLVPPGSGLLHQMYPEGYSPASKTSLPVTPAICAAIEASTAIRYLCGMEVPLERKLLIGSVADMSFDIISFQ
ncbi:MAG: HesA/MoeB/ThiF family protein [Mogibacterium sp.]|nr:HesA/MoeB/ThiF family protein [Mogibacterium sp.]MBR4091541.1 HesA/MoeB/ThiF family protein [Mogibacterium sp.]